MNNKTIGQILDELYEVREQRRDLASQDKALRLQYEELEQLALDEMKRLGLEKASGEMSSASVSQNTVPSVVDWGKLMRYIARHKAFHLFEKRVSKSAWVEEVESRRGRDLPGVESFTKIGLNVRSR